MAEATQFCIGLENKPGVLAKLCGCLRRANVNVDALFVSDDEECCWVNVVASPTPAARDALTEGGYHFYTEKVLTVQGENRPGQLEQISTKLTEAGINIIYIYGSAVGSSFTAVLNVSDLDQAAKVLEG